MSVNKLNLTKRKNIMTHKIYWQTPEGEVWTYVFDSYQEAIELLDDIEDSGIDGTFTYTRVNEH